MNNIHAIIQARLNSTRFPGKVLVEFSGDTLLGHILKRVSKSKLISKVIVATTVNSRDDEIVEYCKSKDTLYFRGDEEDVLKRYYECSLRYGSDIIVRITADDPLKDPKIIDQAIKIFIQNDYDYVSNTINPTFPEGIDVEVFSFAALKKAYIKSKLNSEREHVTPYIYNNPKEFKCFNFLNKVNMSHLRWTIDNEDDLRLIEEIYGFLYKKPNEIFLSEEVYELINKNEYLTQINNKYIRNEGYLKSISEDNNEKK